MCHCWKEQYDYMTKDDVIAFVNELDDWLKGNFILHIAGGEPLVFKGIFEIVSHCKSRNIMCKLTTNGYGLNEKVCQDLIQSGLSYLTVSIDSHKAEIHDAFRGKKGTHVKALWGLNYLSEHSDMALGVSCIIMNENISYMREFCDFLLNLKVDRILFQPIRDYYNPIEQWTSYQYWIDDHDVLDAGVDYLIQLRKENSKILNPIEDFEIVRAYFKDPYSIVNKQECYIGYERLFVDDKGEITLCDAYASLGNIKEGNLKDMWSSTQAKGEREKMLSCTLPCTSNCKKDLSITNKIGKFFQLYDAGLFK